MDYQQVIYEKKDHVAVITLNRPERMNSMTITMQRELSHAWQDVKKDPNVTVAILTGTGDRAFCAGLDVAELKERASTGSVVPTGDSPRSSPLENGVWKPVICALNGMCVGGAITMVGQSDIVIAAEHAVLIDSRVTVGQVAMGGTMELLRKAPLGEVFKLAYLGRGYRLTAQRMYDFGLVTDVVPLKDLMPKALEMAKAIAQNSPDALIATKRAVWNSAHVGLRDAIAQGWEVFKEYQGSGGHPDQTEGPNAFLEKRAAKWTPGHARFSEKLPSEK